MKKHWTLSQSVKYILRAQDIFRAALTEPELKLRVTKSAGKENRKPSESVSSMVEGEERRKYF